MQHKFFNMIPIMILSLGLIACSSDETNNEEGTVGDINFGSHNAGMNCMSSNCHVQGGAGEGIFTTSGTIYKSNGGAQPDATVILYIHNTNTIVASLDTDVSGNFYTTQPIDELFTGNGFVTGVDVEVHAPGGSSTMPGLTTEGACSSCHGDSVGRINAN